MARLRFNSFVNRKSQQGQSLIELLIAVTVGAILVGSAAILLVTALKASSQNKFIQTASFLAQDLVEKVTVFAEAKWYCPSGSTTNCGIYNLLKDGTHYYLNVDSTPFQWVLLVPPQTGGESIAVDGVTYTRYFFVRDVCRRGSTGNIAGPVIEPSPNCSNILTNIVDPSTQQVTAVVEWTDQGGGSVKIVKFLTRHGDRVTVQTDWSGGPTSPSSDPVVNAGINTNSFYSATSIDFTSVPGSIKIGTL